MIRSLFIALCLAACVAAEDAPSSPVKKLKPPKGVVLTAEQKQQLDIANECLEKGYRLLIDEHKPELAVQELRKAYAITQMMNTLKGTETVMAGVAPGNEKGTPHDKLETQGGMEKIVEIGFSTGVGAPPEVENGLYKRKIIKATEEERKKIEAEQKSVTIEVQQLATAGAGGGEDKPKDNDETKKLETPDAAQPNAPNEANQPPQAGKPQTADAKQKQQQKGGGAAATQTAQNQQNEPDAGNQNQNNPDAKQPQQGQEPNAAQTAENKQNQPNQPSQSSAGKQNPNAKQQQQNGPGAPNAQTAQNNNPQQNDNQNQNNPGAPAANANAQAVANKEDAVARALNDMANQYAQMKGADANRTASKFRQAAAAAARTADMIRNKEFNAAAASSADAERKIGEALQDAGFAAAKSMDETIGAIKKQVEKLQNDQQKILAQAQTAGQDPGGAPAPDSVKKDRQTALMLEESKLKPQIEQLQNAINELANGGEANGGDTHTADKAAREELGKARGDLQKSKARQAVVDATMKLGEGDLQGAAAAMAKVQDAFNRVQERLNAADNALTGGEGNREERDLDALRELGAKLTRLKNNAQTAAGNPADPKAQGKGSDGGQPNSKKTNGDQAKPGAKNDDKLADKTPGEGKPDANDNPPGEKASENKNETGGHGEVSASWGQVLNMSARQINSELLAVAGRMAKNAPNAKLMEELARKDPAFERDFDRSIEQIESLLSAVEKLEAGLAEKVEKEKEKKAMKNYRKDEIPGAYKPAVAAYYEELSKTGENR